MQTLDFILIVLPLGMLVVTLVGVVLFIARKQDIKQKKIKHSIEKFSKEKEKKQAEFKSQQSELNRMLELNSLDQETYDRLSLIVRMNEKKLDETIDELISLEKEKKNPKKEPETPSSEIEYIEIPEEIVEDLPLEENEEKTIENTPEKPLANKINKKKKRRKTYTKLSSTKGSKKKHRRKADDEPFIIIFNKDKTVKNEQKIEA